jgi:carboxylesterase type B
LFIRIPASCFQRSDSFFADFAGSRADEPVSDLQSEDCLYLNVFAPPHASDASQNKKRLPVLVWLHGGGFARGAAFVKGTAATAWRPDPR